MIQVTIDGKGYEYPENCSYYEIAKDFEKTMDAPIVLVKVDGRLRELHKQLKKDCELEFVTTEDEIGHKTYQRSLSLLLVKAVYHVGGYDKIRHVMLHFSAGSGFFYTVDGDITLNQEFLDEVKAYMHEQVEKAVPIYKRSVDTHEARERFRLHGMTDKDRLFRYRRVSRVNLYSLGDFEDYYYGFMTYDTSYLKYFDLYLYDDGFVLQMPEKKAPETVPAAVSVVVCAMCLLSLAIVRQLLWRSGGAGCQRARKCRKWAREVSALAAGASCLCGRGF